MKSLVTALVVGILSSCASTPPVVEERYVAPSQNSESEIDSARLMSPKPSDDDESSTNSSTIKTKLTQTCTDATTKTVFNEGDPGYHNCLSSKGASTGFSQSFGDSK